MSDEGRRAFIKRGIAAGACAVGTTGLTALLHSGGKAVAGSKKELLPTGKDHGVKRPADAKKMSIAEGSSPAKNVQKAVEALGGMSAFVSRGERVLVKPNVGWDRSPSQAATTDPEAVGEIVRMCVEAGAAEVVVSDHPCNDPERTFLRSGIGKATEEAGGKVLLPALAGYVNMDIGGEALGEWPVIRPFAEAERVINCPVAKHHSLSGTTLCMKNWFGILGGRRGRLHQRIEDSVVELYAFARPTLSILDATRILLRNGPQGGRLSDVAVRNTVAAGIDEVALDAFGAHLFGLKPKDVGSIISAEKMGLGVSDFESLNPVRIKS